MPIARKPQPKTYTEKAAEEDALTRYIDGGGTPPTVPTLTAPAASADTGKGIETAKPPKQAAPPKAAAGEGKGRLKALTVKVNATCYARMRLYGAKADMTHQDILSKALDEYLVKYDSDGEVK